MTAPPHKLPDGWRVVYIHARVMNRGAGAIGPMSTFRGLARNSISPRGGYTVATFYDENDNEILVSKAKCHPNDNFNRRTGRAIAFGRGMKILEQRGLV